MPNVLTMGEAVSLLTQQAKTRAMISFVKAAAGPVHTLLVNTIVLNF